MKVYTEYSDEELTSLLNQGVADAFTEIYNRYWSKLFYLAAKKLANQYEAEEAVQDIFLSFWKNRETFVLKGNLSHYFAVAVKFQVIKRRSRRVIQAKISELLSEESEADFLSNHGQDWTQDHLENLQEQLDKVIDTLPKKCKLVFTMSREEDNTNKKIAAQLGITEKAVEKHISKAFRVLKTVLGHKVVLIAILNELI